MGKYLYNGVRLPKLPEWDKTVYPYAVISNADGWGGCRLFVLTDVSKHHVEYDEGTPTLPAGWEFYFGVGCKYIQSLCDETTDIWSEFDKETTVNFATNNFSDPVWANFDILNEDGTLYLAASDPVPVFKGTYEGEERGWVKTPYIQTYDKENDTLTFKITSISAKSITYTGEYTIQGKITITHGENSVSKDLISWNDEIPSNDINNVNFTELNTYYELTNNDGTSIELSLEIPNASQTTEPIKIQLSRASETTYGLLFYNNSNDLDGWQVLDEQAYSNDGYAEIDIIIPTDEPEEPAPDEPEELIPLELNPKFLFMGWNFARQFDFKRFSSGTDTPEEPVEPEPGTPIAEYNLLDFGGSWRGDNIEDASGEASYTRIAFSVGGFPLHFTTKWVLSVNSEVVAPFNWVSLESLRFKAGERVRIEARFPESDFGELEYDFRRVYYSFNDADLWSRHYFGITYESNQSQLICKQLEMFVSYDLNEVYDPNGRLVGFVLDGVLESDLVAIDITDQAVSITNEKPTTFSLTTKFTDYDNLKIVVYEQEE